MNNPDKELKFIYCAKNKYEIIKRILKINDKYTSDYLMTWTKKMLINYYNSCVRNYNLELRENINNENR